LAELQVGVDQVIHGVQLVARLLVGLGNTRGFQI
jgi:hypothetical protein